MKIKLKPRSQTTIQTVPGREAERNEKVWALSVEPGRERGGKSEVLMSHDT